jgi:hypothetical protein
MTDWESQIAARRAELARAEQSAAAYREERKRSQESQRRGLQRALDHFLVVAVEAARELDGRRVATQPFGTRQGWPIWTSRKHLSTFSRLWLDPAGAMWIAYYPDERTKPTSVESLQVRWLEGPMAWDLNCYNLRADNRASPSSLRTFYGNQHAEEWLRERVVDIIASA